MKKLLRFRRIAVLLAAVWLFTACLLTGCKSGGEEKVEDLAFTVVGQNEIPQELQDIISQKERQEFRLTFTSGEDLYIAVGYGEQKTGGYSITVPEFYLTSNSIIIKTELQGPEQGAQTGEAPSNPFIVIKTQLLEKPVVFQ